MAQAPGIAKGKVKVGYVLSGKLIDRIKHRAVDRKMHASHLVEEILSRGLKQDSEPALAKSARD